MSLPLKVKIAKTGQTKVLKFAPNMSVAECCKNLLEKGVEGAQDHGLFQPAGPKNPARWLRNDRTLMFYDLQPNDEIEYKKRHRPIKIKLLDDTIKTVLIDDTLSVAEIVAVIGEKMSISNADEYSLKVQGKVDWLIGTQSLHEQGVAEDAVMNLEKKFYVTDAAVSVEDPVSLHMVFIQCREAILQGKYPCNEEEAVQFASLGCQIIYGSFDPAKNRVLELEKLLAPFWQKQKKIDEKITKEHKKLVGMNESNAKYRFVQLCRSLKTYGVTFFKCKLRIDKIKKKTKPMLLGITRDAVIFMDEETKEITKEIPLAHLRRWAAAPTTFTLDFGDHMSEYTVFETNEAEAISQLLSGYIDILLKKRKDGNVIIGENNDNIAEIEPIAPISSTALTSVTMATIRNMQPMGTMANNTMMTQMYGRQNITSTMAVPTHLGGAQQYVGSLITDLNSGNPFARNAQLTAQQWRNQLISNTTALVSSVGKLSAAMPPNTFDKSGMDSKAAEIATNLAQLISAARNAAYKANGEEDPDLLNGAKMVADAIKELLAATKDLADHPNDPRAIERFNQAKRALQAATGFLNAANKNNLADEPSQKLIMQSAKNVAEATDELLNLARNNNQGNNAVLVSADQAKRVDEELQAQVGALAASILDSNSQKQLQVACQALDNAIGRLLGTAQSSGDSTGLMLAAKDISDALAQLLASSRIAEAQNKMPDFSSTAKEILDEITRMMGSYGNPAQIQQSQKLITANTAKIAQAARDAASMFDDENKERLLNAIKGVAAATQKLIQAAQTSAMDPNNQDAHKVLQDACQRLADAIKALVGDAAEKAAMKNLRGAAKAAAAATSGLINASKQSANTCSDPNSVESLRSNAKQVAEALTGMVKSLEHAWSNPDDQAAQEALLKETHNTSPAAYKLVAAAKSALPRITDANNKNILRQAADDAAEALQKLVAANKAVIVSSGQATIDQALERFAAEEAALDSALIDVDSGSLLLDPNQTPEGAAHLLNIAARQVAGSIKQMATTAKSAPDDLGNASTVVSDAVAQTNTAAKLLASTLPERAAQRHVLTAARDLTLQAKAALTSARSVAANPSDPNLNGLLAASARSLAEALAALLNAAKGVASSNKDCDEAANTIAAAMRSIEARPGNVKDYPVYAEDLENSIKALQAASLALVNAARNNPKGVGAAAKSTAVAVTPLINTANLAAGSAASAQTRDNILSATQETGNSIQDLITAAKLVASKDDPKLKEDLAHAANIVATSLDKLLSALSATPATKQFADAIDEIMKAAGKLNNHTGSLPHSDLSDAIESIKAGTTKLGEATKGVIASSRSPSEVEKMGVYSKQASGAITGIVDASLILANLAKTSNYSEGAQKLKECSAEMVSLCLSTDPAAKQGVIKSARDVTVATQALAETIRKTALESDSESAQILVNCSQAIAGATAVLVNSAKSAASGQPGSAEKLTAAKMGLDEAVDDLLQRDPHQVSSGKSNRLMNTAQQAATATSSMIELSRVVHKKPSDTQAISDLSTAARNVGAAIKALLDAAKSIGEIDLEDSINTITNAISDLDQATISATVGLLENTAGNKSGQQLEEELVEVAREIAAAIKQLVTEKDSPVNLARAARTTANLIPKLAKVSTALASAQSDPEKQQDTLGSAKAIADAALMMTNACKQSDISEITVQAKEGSMAIAKLLGSLKGGVIALRDCDEAAKAVAESARPLNNFNINVPVDRSKSYADSQRELTAMAKELAAALAQMVSIAKTRPQEVGESAKKIASLMPKFVADTTDAMSTIAETDVRVNLLESAKNVVNASEKLIKGSKVVASDAKNPKNQQLMSGTYKEVTESIAQLVSAIKKGATGELKCEESIDSINKRIGELDSAALFVATGQLSADNDDVDIDELQTNIAANGKRIEEAMKKLIAAAPRNQQELGNAAYEASDAFEAVTRDTKNLAAQGNNLLIQQELLMGAKGVGMTIQLAVTSGLGVNKKPDDRELLGSLADCGLKVSEAIKDLTNLTAAATAASGIKDIEAAKKNVNQALDTIASQPGNKNAGAADILKSAKTLADSVATISTAGPEEGAKVTQAAIDIGTCAPALLFDSKGAGRLTDPQSAKRLFETAQATTQATVSFLEAAKVHRRLGNPETQMKISEANDELVRVIGEFVEATKPLPGSDEALKLFQETDELEQLAEQELRNAASIIEEAAKTLLEAKRRQLEMRKNKESPLPDEQINEAIIEAARAIASATATLVNAATQAQKELVQKGHAEKKQNLYRRDPAWAKGLISAAQAVAGSVKSLVTAANGAASGNAEEEALIASAKGVAAATARLVYASRTKADPFSPTQKSLSAAAKSVASATKQLVEAARSAQQVSDQIEAKPDWDGMGETEKKKQELEQQTKILKLAKELESAQKHLLDMRKKEYQEATGNPSPSKNAPPEKPAPRPVPTGASPNRPQPVPTGAPGRPQPVPRPAGGVAPPTALKKIGSVEKVYSLEQLKTKPTGLDPLKLETYLSDEDFQRVFNMDREAFAKLPEWKRSSVKKQAGLL